MLKGESLLEEFIRAAETYRPRLEEMFGVDLSSCQVKSARYCGEDLYALLQSHAYDGTDLQERLEKMRGRAEAMGSEEYISLLTSVFEEGFGYIPLVDTIHVPEHLRNSAPRVHIIAVHELAHAVHVRINPGEITAQRTPLSKVVSEGFAEHVSLSLFSHLYAADGIDEAIQRHLHPPLVERLAGHISSGLLLSLWPDSSVNFAYDYTLGRHLFVLAAAEGIGAAALLESPPGSVDEILDGAYFSRLKGK